MKNYWLENRYLTQIWQQLEVDQCHEVYGKFYVIRYIRKTYEAWVINPLLAQPDCLYLHTDGVWVVNSTSSEDGWTGYFDTKEEAERTLSEHT